MSFPRTIQILILDKTSAGLTPTLIELIL